MLITIIMMLMITDNNGENNSDNIDDNDNMNDVDKNTIGYRFRCCYLLFVIYIILFPLFLFFPAVPMPWGENPGIFTDPFQSSSSYCDLEMPCGREA